MALGRRGASCVGGHVTLDSAHGRRLEAAGRQSAWSNWRGGQLERCTGPPYPQGLSLHDGLYFSSGAGYQPHPSLPRASSLEGQPPPFAAPYSR
uniref:Uncharacterized protein n=1 Tax=Arundo donax TaxID=35708 RepID=A0A0A9DFQ3_ARUDO